MKLQTLLFDLDGTILDTNELIISSFLHALDGQTRQERLTRDEIIPHMGRPLIDQLRQFSGREDVEELVQAYFEFNLREHDAMAAAFPHVTEVISRIGDSGIKLGVVTTKRRETALMGIKLLGLASYIKVLISIDDVTEPKPSPEGVLKAIDLLQADPQTTMMIGDSQYDIQAGQRAGVHTAGVAWSIKGEQHLAQFKPDYMLHDMRELLQLTGVVEESEWAGK
ncbi:pyrophosphatase PpaX [Paenibacillus senegalensis]|uniref:pyrophosphatase PpaX n=1 Tax=Paenibacillus senegalensis TaxID=1465766 RepID=UPI000287FBD6|nr:pyrophosphatase PpaX [Paenibacillus senegalensis]